MDCTAGLQSLMLRMGSMSPGIWQAAWAARGAHARCARGAAAARAQPAGCGCVGVRLPGRRVRRGGAAARAGLGARAPPAQRLCAGRLPPAPATAQAWDAAKNTLHIGLLCEARPCLASRAGPHQPSCPLEALSKPVDVPQEVFFGTLPQGCVACPGAAMRSPASYWRRCARTRATRAGRPSARRSPRGRWRRAPRLIWRARAAWRPGRPRWTRGACARAS